MYTNHAKARCQQRGIRSEVVDALISFGECKRHRGGDVYYMDRKARARARGSLNTTNYKRVVDQLDTYVVMADDGSIITAAKRRIKLKF